MLLKLTAPTGDLLIDSEPRIGGVVRVAAEGFADKVGAIRVVLDLQPSQVARAIEALREAQPKVDAPSDKTDPAAPDPWVHRSKRMRCSSCMWYVTKGENNSILGRCRRHAPTMGGYPVVFVSDWCGDHKMDETAPEASAAF